MLSYVFKHTEQFANKTNKAELSCSYKDLYCVEHMGFPHAPFPTLMFANQSLDKRSSEKIMHVRKQDRKQCQNNMLTALTYYYTFMFLFNRQQNNCIYKCITTHENHTTQNELETTDISTCPSPRAVPRSTPKWQLNDC